jgi:hypothetical protein
MGTFPFHESIYRSRNPEFGVYFKSEFIHAFYNMVVQSGAYKCSVLFVLIVLMYDTAFFSHELVNQLNQ